MLFKLIILFILSFFIIFANFNKSSDEIQCDSEEMLKNYSIITIANEIKEILRGTAKDFDYFINNIMSKLTYNVDEKSKIVIMNYKRMIKYYVKCSKFKVFISEENKKRHNNYMKKISSIKSYVQFEEYDENVFEYHHGLKYSNERIKKYIQNKNIMDIGAFQGDSIFILQNYTNKLIYSYELSNKNIDDLKFYMNKNGIDDNVYRIVNKGMSNHLGLMRFNNAKGQGPSLSWKGKTEIELSTIDEEVRINKMNVGFIKIDVEGEGLNVLMGGKNTIQKQRPVISIGIYHNYDELINTKSYFENEFADYNIEYQLHNDCKPYACEINLFAYPTVLK